MTILFLPPSLVPTLATRDCPGGEGHIGRCRQMYCEACRKVATDQYLRDREKKRIESDPLV